MKSSDCQEIESNSPNLEILDLSFNRLIKITEDIKYLNTLTNLKLNNNSLKELPYSIGKLINLKFLSLDHNKLSTIPSSIGSLNNLQILSLSHNNVSPNLFLSSSHTFYKKKTHSPLNSS